MQPCPNCRRALTGPDTGCARCDRPPLDAATRNAAINLVEQFTTDHAADPWLRSAGLLSYSLRSRRRGFLDDPARPFTRAALRLLHQVAKLGAASGPSPLAETALATVTNTALAHALSQLLDRYGKALAEPGDSFEEWLERN